MEMLVDLVRKTCIVFYNEVVMHFFRSATTRRLITSALLAGSLLAISGCTRDFLVMRRICDGSIGYPYNDFCRDAK